MDEEEDLQGVRIPLGNGTYATKVRGKLVMVRDRKPETAFDVGMDLLGEAFGGPSRTKSNKGSPNLEDFQTPHFQQHPINMVPRTQNATESSEQLNMVDPNQSESRSPNLGPGPEVTMGPHGYGPYPRVGYDRGNRQLALLPIGGNHSMNSNTNPYSQSWVYPQSYMRGYPPYGTSGNSNPWHSFMQQWTPNALTSHNFTVTKHICANCGRLRSRKYQAENPIIAGEPPIPAFCRKCQKDASSTDDGSDASQTESRGLKKSRKRQGKDQKKSRTQNQERKGKDDAASSKESILSEVREDFAASKKDDKERLQGDYVVVEDYEDRGRGRRSSTLRIKIHNEPNISKTQEQPSPLVQQTFHARPRSCEPLNRARYICRKSSPSPQRDFSTGRGMTRPSSLVEPISRNPSPWENFRETVRVGEFEDVCRGRSRNPRPQYDGYEHDRRDRARRVGKDDYEYHWNKPKQEYIVEERDTDTSSTKSDCRRYERIHLTPPPQRCGQLPHNIGPLRDDEVVVVTERYVYRPKRLPSVTKQEVPSLMRRKQDQIDRTTLGTATQYQRFGAESEASDYYHNDWDREKLYQEMESTSRRRVRTKDLMDDFSRPRSRIADNTLDTSADDLCQPRVPSRPAARRRIDRDVEDWAETSAPAAPYSLGDQEAASSHREGPKRATHTEIRRNRNPYSSYRPPYVREGTDGGTEKALIPSPRHSRERRFIPEDMSEATEEIERLDTRRVQFREPEVRDAWSAASPTSHNDADGWAHQGEHGRW